MRKILIMALVALTTTMQAAPVDSLTARRQAESFASLMRKSYDNRQTHRMAAKSADRVTDASPVLSRVAMDAPLHIYNIGGGGFVILSGDSRTAPVLAYGLSGAVDTENMPDGMRYMIDEYSKAVAKIMQSGDGAASDAPTAANPHPWSQDWATVEPLVTTAWSQDDPYNTFAPVIGGERSYTGCLATAMAQIMKYWQHPVSSTAIPDYVAFNGVRYDGCEPTTFKWDKMADILDENTDRETAEAVAELIDRCGRASKMGFSPIISGASTNDGVRALYNYLGYDGSLKKESSFGYRYDDWERLIYNELANRRPVIYSGYTSTLDGHAFVCDGFDNGYFHINFGWGGNMDGYYLLSLFNDNTAYIFGNEAFVSIKPYEGNALVEEPEDALSILHYDFDYPYWISMLVENGHEEKVVMHYNMAIEEGDNLKLLMSDSKYVFGPYWDVDVSLLPSYPKSYTPGIHNAYIVCHAEGREWQVMSRVRYLELEYDAEGRFVGARVVDCDVPYSKISTRDSEDLRTVKEGDPVDIELIYANNNAGRDISGGAQVSACRIALYDTDAFTPYYSYHVGNYDMGTLFGHSAALGSMDGKDVIITDILVNDDSHIKVPATVPVTIADGTVTLSSEAVFEENGHYFHVAMMDGWDTAYRPVVLHIDANGDIEPMGEEKYIVMLQNDDPGPVYPWTAGTWVGIGGNCIFTQVENGILRGTPEVIEVAQPDNVIVNPGKTIKTVVALPYTTPGLYFMLVHDKYSMWVKGQNIYVAPASSGISTVSASSTTPSAMKRLTKDGRILIERNGVWYDVTGVKNAPPSSSFYQE